MVIMLLADGFEEIEALTVVDILRRSNLIAKTVSIGSDQMVTGAHGIQVQADLTEGEISPDEIEMLILPGGPGAENLANSEFVRYLLKKLREKDLPLGAICAAPSVPGRMGLLKGKKAVCYPGYEDMLLGAEIGKGPVCEDGWLITGNGPGAAFAFGFAIAAKLAGPEKAKEIKKKMLVK